MQGDITKLETLNLLQTGRSCIWGNEEKVALVLLPSVLLDRVGLFF